MATKKKASPVKKAPAKNTASAAKKSAPAKTSAGAAKKKSVPVKTSAGAAKKTAPAKSSAGAAKKKATTAKASAAEAKKKATSIKTPAGAGKKTATAKTTAGAGKKTAATKTPAGAGKKTTTTKTPAGSGKKTTTGKTPAGSGKKTTSGKTPAGGGKKKGPSGNTPVKTPAPKPEPGKKIDQGKGPSKNNPKGRVKDGDDKEEQVKKPRGGRKPAPAPAPTPGPVDTDGPTVEPDDVKGGKQGKGGKGKADTHGSVLLGNGRLSKTIMFYEIDEHEDGANKKKVSSELKNLEKKPTMAVRRKASLAEETQEELTERILKELEEQNLAFTREAATQICTRCNKNLVSPEFWVDKHLGYCEECAAILKLGQSKEARKVDYQMGLLGQDSLDEEDEDNEFMDGPDAAALKEAEEELAELDD